MFVSIGIFSVERAKNFLVWENRQNTLLFTSIIFVSRRILLELSFIGRVIWLGGESSVEWFSWLRSFVIVMILQILSFLANVTYFWRGVSATWFGFEYGFVDKNIVDDEKSLSFNLKRRGIVMIVSLGWDIY